MDNSRIQFLAFISYCLSIIYYALSIAETLNIFIIIIAIIVGGFIILKYQSIRDTTKLYSNFLLKIKKMRYVEKVFFAIIIFAVAIGIILIIYSSLITNNAPESRFVKVADSQILYVGEIWKIGNGWELSFNQIDSYSTPKRAFFTIYRNGTRVDDIFLTENETYSYNNTFIITVSQIFAGNSQIVKLTEIYIATDSILI